MTDNTYPTQVGLLIYSHRGIVEVEVYADPQGAQTAYHRWWTEQGIGPDNIDDVKSDRHDGESLDWTIAPVKNGAEQHTTNDQDPAPPNDTGPIHWLRCDHPLCFARWEGTSLEATYDEHLDEYLCPACGGASAVHDLGIVPESVLKFAQITRDKFYDPIDRGWEAAARDLPCGFRESAGDLHRVIVHTALACGKRLPVHVLLDYLDVITALSETTGTYLDREPGWDVILAERNEVLFALERAAHGEWPVPVEPSDFAAWFVDEAEIQRDLVEDEHDTQEIEARLAYAEKLDAIVGRLATQGITPGKLPWES
jgi:hypothetical protein